MERSQPWHFVDKFHYIRPYYLDYSSVTPFEKYSVDIQVEDKFDAINALVDTFVDVMDGELLEEIREAIISREKLCQLVGQGLAIPHGKTDAIDENYVAFARSRTSRIQFN